MSLSNLLAFLRRSPLLESVIIDFHGECVHDAPKHDMVSLKALKTLYISGSGLVGQGNNSLLARLELQKGVEVTVMLLMLDGRSDAIAHAIPPHPDAFPSYLGSSASTLWCFPAMEGVPSGFPERMERLRSWRGGR